MRMVSRCLHLKLARRTHLFCNPLAALAALLLVTGCDAPAEKEAEASADQVDQAIRPTGSPFPEASQVRLFVELDWSMEDQAPVFSKPDGLLLESAEREKLEQALIIGPAPEWGLACFIPHHFFRYYDENGVQVGEIEVCFCCDEVRTSSDAHLTIGEGEILDADYALLRQLVADLGEPTDVQCS